MAQAPNIPQADLVEQYRREMMELYQRQPAPTTDDWLEQRYPEPDIERDKSAIIAQDTFFYEDVAETPAPTSSETPTEPPAIAPTPFIGYLRVFAVTASGAEPIQGARVSVSNDGVVYAETITDRDGYTQVIPLPTVDPALSLQPNNPAPYVAYTVLTEADGFRSVRHNNLPVYGNDFVTQTVMLMPLTPGDDPTAVLEFSSGAPTNL